MNGVRNWFENVYIFWPMNGACEIDFEMFISISLLYFLMFECLIDIYIFSFNSFKLNLEENYTFIWPELLANKCQITYMHMK